MNLKILRLIMCLCISLIACNKIEKVDTVKQIDITIRIKDSIDHKQRYLLHIVTDGKQVNHTAILPQDMSLITNENKEAAVRLYTNVQYTIKVYKTDKKSINEFYNKPKKSPPKFNNDNGNLLITKKIKPTIKQTTHEIILK